MVPFYFRITYEVFKKRKYCKRMSEKKFSPCNGCPCFVCFRRQNKQKKFPNVCLSVCTWTFAMNTLTFEGIRGSKRNLVGVLYVWNEGLVWKSKVKSWSWSWSWSWTGFWFWQKLWGTTPYLVGIFSIYRITFSNEFYSEILILVMIVILILKKDLKKVCGTKLNFMSIINIQNVTIQKSITKWYTDPDRNLTESKNWLKLIDKKLFKSIITHSIGKHIYETSTHSSDVWTNKSFCYLTLCESSWKVSVIFLIFTICLIDHNN